MFRHSLAVFKPKRLRVLITPFGRFMWTRIPAAAHPRFAIAAQLQGAMIRIKLKMLRDTNEVMCVGSFVDPV